MHFIGVPNTTGWLQKARLALLLSGHQVARDLGMNAAAYLRMEQNEERVSLGRIRRAASAMNCDLVYAIRPQVRLPFSKVILNQLIGQGLEFRHIDWALIQLRDRMKDKKVRDGNGWSKPNQHHPAKRYSVS
jgi:transcriptional regulator with XRE-family HTH domain